MSALQLAIQVATRKRDDESRLVAQALRKLQGAQAQLTQLHAYADESHGRWSAQTGRVLNPALMAHHYQFMDRLRHATGLQDGVVLQMNRQLEAARKHLMAAECRLAVLEKVLEKQRLLLLN
jgi:flagellar FliJ protein